MPGGGGGGGVYLESKPTHDIPNALVVSSQCQTLISIILKVPSQLTDLLLPRGSCRQSAESFLLHGIGRNQSSRQLHERVQYEDIHSCTRLAWRPNSADKPNIRLRRESRADLRVCLGNGSFFVHLVQEALFEHCFGITGDRSFFWGLRRLWLRFLGGFGLLLFLLLVFLGWIVLLRGVRGFCGRDGLLWPLGQLEGLSGLHDRAIGALWRWRGREVIFHGGERLISFPFRLSGR